MHRKTKLLLLLALVGAASLASAQPTSSRDVPPPPPLPKAKTSSPPPVPEESLEPEITITTRDGVTHEEYRVNGHLYKVKIMPRVGPPYYLIYDEQGRARRSELESDTVPPSWVIKRF